jgi:hypothetical protein
MIHTFAQLWIGMTVSLRSQLRSGEAIYPVAPEDTHHVGYIGKAKSVRPVLP